MRYLLPFVLVAAFGLACGTDAQPTVAQTPTTDALKKVPSSTATPTDLASPELAPFRQFVEAVNRADTAAALALLTEDVVWERGGQCPPAACKGKRLAERELTRDVGAHHLITPLTVDQVDNVPRVRVELRTDGTRRGGAERIIQFFSLELRDGKIAAVRVAFDTTDPATAAFVASQAGTQR